MSSEKEKLQENIDKLTAALDNPETQKQIASKLGCEFWDYIYRGSGPMFKSVKKKT